ISFKLKDVLYVPKATHNLVSISRLDREGGGTHIQNGTMRLYSKDGKQFAQAELTKGLYVLTARATVHPYAFANVAEDRTPRTWIDWH
ncbi:hypothetical protein M405DRAFT_712724, partial [Rhizopogon salebrosus TDB-379]